MKSPKSNLVGINSRLDEIQASILDIKLGYLNKLIEKRINIAKQFNNKIDPNFYVLPFNNSANKHTYHLYVIQTKNRDKLLNEFKQIKYLLGCYKHLITEYKGYKKYLKVPFKIKNTEILYKNALSIPNHPFLKNEIIRF